FRSQFGAVRLARCRRGTEPSRRATPPPLARARSLLCSCGGGTPGHATPPASQTTYLILSPRKYRARCRWSRAICGNHPKATVNVTSDLAFAVETALEMHVRGL